MTVLIFIIYFYMILQKGFKQKLLFVTFLLQVWCQVLHVMTHFFTVCNYAWMFCEGFYLHALIVIAFTKDKKLLYMCYVIGWGKLSYEHKTLYSNKCEI